MSELYELHDSKNDKIKQIGALKTSIVDRV